jgi:hypothetical protein
VRVSPKFGSGVPVAIHKRPGVEVQSLIAASGTASGRRAARARLRLRPGPRRGSCRPTRCPDPRARARARRSRELRIELLHE